MRKPLEWLINEYQTNMFVTAFNICKNVEDAKDVSKSFWHRNINKDKMSLENYIQNLPFETKEDSALFEAVLNLPEKYRIVIHLFYYEDWSIREISQILHIRESNVKTRLSRGRKLLKDVLKEDWSYDE